MSNYEKKDDPSTLLRKMGFQDGDLKTPKHDEIMLWLDAKVESIVQEIVGPPKPPYVREGEEFVSRRQEIKKTWERPLVAGRNNFVAGFIDMHVEVSWIETHKTAHGWVGDKRKMVPYDRQCTVAEIAFEVKSTIPSLGELIRQIRFMKTHVADYTKFIVVCGDDRFLEPLKAQGIGFLKYEP